MNADPKKRKSRIATLAIAIELVALYRITKIFRSLRANREQRGESANPLQKSR
jgi:hypothetical protein